MAKRHPMTAVAFALGLSFLVVPTEGLTQESTVRDSLARALFEVMTPPGQTERTLDLVMQATTEGMFEELAAIGLTDEARQRISAELRTFFLEDLDLESEIRRVSIPLYAEYFSEEQLREILEFHQTPTGQALLARTPELVASIQTAMVALDPQIEEFVTELLFREMEAFTNDFLAGLDQIPVENRRLTIGVEASGRLSDADPEGPDGAHMQAWALGLSAGQEVTADLLSSDFDAFLIVTGPGLVGGLFDDDSGGGCDARITFTTTEDGEYRAIVSTASPGGTGDFVLRLGDMPPPMTPGPCDPVRDQASDADSDGVTVSEPVDVPGLDDPERLVELAQGITRGDPDAPLTILEFGDYQCPACGAFASGVKPLVDVAYIESGRARFVFYDFPLTEIHPHAFLAARAARCAGDQGGYWEYHDVLFRNQPSWSAQSQIVSTLVDYASEAGLAAAPFETCLRSDRHAQVVSANMRLGRELGVPGTPTIMVRGASDTAVRLDSHDFQSILAAVEALDEGTGSTPVPITPSTVLPSILNRDDVTQALVKVYPPDLVALGIGGTANVHVLVDEVGNVRRVQIAESSGRQALDDAALAVAHIFRFTPAKNGEQAVPVWIIFPITFQVQ